MSGAGQVPGGRGSLSTAATYPELCAAAFELAGRLGYDRIEVMVWTDPVSQDPSALRRLSDHYSLPIVAIHAPTLLITQRVWGTDPWPKLDRACEVAAEVGAETVVVHPPFRWQRDYARTFVDGIRDLEDRTGVRLAVENMFPWRGRHRGIPAHLPRWGPGGFGHPPGTLHPPPPPAAGS